MPRTIDEIIERAEDLAARFENHEPADDDIRDASALREVRRAFLTRAEAEQLVIDSVKKARTEGHSWASIGAMIGTSGEAARQRYGQKAPKL
ncbi:MAG: hypothetical protein GEU79_10965 [Acidimicrobiia bacterium]|nr:hypothetical protein [Acidimicrobiia bacterium]